MAILTIAELTVQFEELELLVDDLRNDGITNVNFETNVEEGDCVYLDTNTNSWKRCLADSDEVPEREVFHGVAHFPTDEDNFVRIYGFDSSDDYTIYNDETDTVIQAFIPGEYVYISTKAAGAYTQTSNNSPCGVAIGIDQFLLASELDNASGAVRQLITDSLTQTLVDYEAAFIADTTTYSTLKDRLDSLLSVIAYNKSLVVDNDEELTAINQLLDDAKGSFNSIDERIGANTNLITTINTLLTASAGSMSDLTTRLAVSINDDGTLKTSTSASTYTTETEAVAYVSTSSFTVATDLTGVYVENRTLRLNDTFVVHILSSSYSAPNTTVVVDLTVVPTPLTKVEYSFSPEELPLYNHDELNNLGTVVPTDTNTTRNKHVSNNDIKTLQDAVDTNASDVSDNAANLALTQVGITRIATQIEFDAYFDGSGTKVGNIYLVTGVTYQLNNNVTFGAYFKLDGDPGVTIERAGLYKFTSAGAVGVHFTSNVYFNGKSSTYTIVGNGGFAEISGTTNSIFEINIRLSACTGNGGAYYSTAEGTTGCIIRNILGCAAGGSGGGVYSCDYLEELANVSSCEPNGADNCNNCVIKNIYNNSSSASTAGGCHDCDDCVFLGMFYGNTSAGTYDHISSCATSIAFALGTGTDVSISTTRGTINF